ncbi:type III pantothenate kinase [Salibacteraceae bacterium]|nr:type III pantothenate kinase [Salibacteraceae bacterium]
MNLCIDIGNSRIKAGFFNETHLIDSVVSEAQFSFELISAWVSEYNTEQIIVSSVRDLNSIEIDKISNEFELSIADRSIPTPFTISYATPETLGLDRILGAAGAQSLFPDSNTLTIDAGTCITYDIVCNGAFIGGAISPGLQMRLNAMHLLTDKLPSLQLSQPAVTFGNSTASSMQMGAEQGAIHEFNGFVNQFLAEIPKLKVIITGGDSTFFERHAENATFAAPNLVLNGLNWVLLEMKRKK